MKTNKKETEVSVPISDELKAADQGFPKDLGYEKITFPRLVLISQDKTEGKGKLMKVVQEAGTFVREFPGKELGENGKPLWEKEELGTEIEGIIFFQRRLLKFYDEPTESWIGTTIYDNEEDVMPLFANKAGIARGTAAELKAKYGYEDPKDKEYNEKNPNRKKMRSRLEDNKVLYVLYDGKIHEMTLKGSSMYSYKDYLKKVLDPSKFLTKFSSEPMEKGQIAWNKMTFSNIRPVNVKEEKMVIENRVGLRQAIAEEKAYFSSLGGQTVGGRGINPVMPTNDEVQKFLKENNEN